MLNKQKTTTISIAILLLISIATPAILLPNANAHSPPWNIPTNAYISAAPNPVGVGQTVSVFLWIDQVLPGAAIENDLRMQNYNLTIISPSGEVTTQLFPTVTDCTSNQGTTFVPSETGNYTLIFSYAGQLNTYAGPYNMGPGVAVPPAGTYTNDTYLPSSTRMTLTVQEVSIPAANGSSPLPTEYWTRPIYGENNYWYKISSNWLGSGSPSYNINAVGSQTSHIMWTSPLQSGGVVGGTASSTLGETYFEGSAYLSRFTNAIILDGMLFYTVPISYTDIPNSMMGNWCQSQL